MSARPDPTLPETPLRKWRKSSGVSYRELARRIGRDWRYVMRLAAGGTMGADTALAIHRETGIGLEELLTSTLPREPRPRPAKTGSSAGLVHVALEVTAIARTGSEPRSRRRGVDL